MIRRIVSFGQVESAWPVSGPVTVVGGAAYVVAGRASELNGGVYLHCLDPASGKLIWTRRLTGSGADSKGGSAGKGDNVVCGTLFSDGRHLFLDNRAFDLKTGADAPRRTIRRGFWYWDSPRGRVPGHAGRWRLLPWLCLAALALLAVDAWPARRSA